MIEGKPLLDIQPEFSSAPTIVGTRGTEVTQISEARRVSQFSGKHAVHTLNHSFLFQSREEIQAFSDFFETVAGKWGAFWCPSWHGELNPTAGIANGATSIVITAVDYATVYLSSAQQNRLGRYIFLLHVDGTLHISKVLAATAGDTLTLQTAVPRAFALGDFIVGFLYYVRFGMDRLTLEFNGPNEARTRLAMIETIIPDSTPKSVTIPPEETTLESFTRADGEEFTLADGEVLTK